ncbi:virion component [Staphylococcus phage Twort]|uniref:ORF041 n=2 Tax=Staphylococcus phage Twort (strain DSM 17442 / HER 48) TaxID=2908167 RepID=Q4Z9D4_BPTWO|nr:virion structural protein [Staphylococcus phage Twort]AAX92337.1 ORF041 [Staphylococcus phage Twort]QIW89116.1 virion component [Staphylococcus phage Twort]
MPQSDGRNTLMRMSLIIPDSNGNKHTYRFKVNPESYTIEHPQRSNIIKTKSDIIFEDYGSDVKMITFSGTTGFKSARNVNGVVQTGKERMDELEERIIEYSNISNSGSVSLSKMELYNWTDNKYYKVHLSPQGLKIERSADKPLLFNYELSLMVLGDAGEPDRSSQVDPEFGNVIKPGEEDVRNRLNNSNSEVTRNRDRNNQKYSVHDNTRENIRMKNGNNLSSNGKVIYNPRLTTNGLSGTLDSTALLIGYGDGGVQT